MLIQINTSYGIRFDSLSEFLFSDGRMGRNGITFGAYMSYNISHKLLRSTQFLETFLEILELSTFQKQIKPLPTPPSPPSMLQYIGRVATPKLAPENCLRYLQTTLVMGNRDWSQNLCQVL